MARKTEVKYRYRNISRRIVGVEVDGTKYNVYPGSTIVTDSALLARHPAFERVGPVEEPKPARQDKLEPDEEGDTPPHKASGKGKAKAKGEAAAETPAPVTPAAVVVNTKE